VFRVVSVVFEKEGVCEGSLMIVLKGDDYMKRVFCDE
jgi:hypothetical protein